MAEGLVRILTRKQSHTRFGAMVDPVGHPVSHRPEIVDDVGEWRPVYDWWLVWQGYILVKRSGEQV